MKSLSPEIQLEFKLKVDFQLEEIQRREQGGVKGLPARWPKDKIKGV